MPAPVTHIAASDAAGITVRGRDLVNDLIGKVGFVEMLYFLVSGRMPAPVQARLLDACLVTLMEHGWTPTSIIARLAAMSVPGEAQVGIAAGLLAVGGVFVGTMEDCGRLLADGIEAPDSDAWCRETVARHRALRTPLPGFGHPIHKPDDPRSARLFALARAAGVEGRFIALLERLSAALDQAMGRHLTINATGAIAAVLLEIGLPPQVMRSLAVVSRAGGLAGHLAEEHEIPAALKIWDLAEHGIPYEDPS